MKKITIIVACLAVVLAGCSSRGQSVAEPDGSPLSPYKVGQSEANAALSQGKLCWKLCGQPMAHDGLFRQVLKDDYKIDLLIVAGCNVTDELEQHVKGYNEIMTKAIVSHFKKDVIPLAESMAKKQFEEQNKE